MAQSSFSIAYEGEALADGTMPVRELAPALLALGELFTEASTILFPDREPVALNIKATKKGSFEVHLVIEAKKAWDELIDIFNSDAASALSNLQSYVIASGAGLFWFLKRMRNRSITKREQSTTPGMIVIVLDDDTRIEIPSEVWLLYESVTIRKEARAVVAPLQKIGVDELRLASGDSPLVIKKTDVPAYELPEVAPEPLLEFVQEQVVELVSVAFEEGRKWRVSDGERQFNVTVEDDAFMARVDSGEPFRKGEMLRCQMRVVQTRRVGLGSGLHTDYFVQEVLEHLSRNQQLSFGGEPE